MEWILTHKLEICYARNHPLDVFRACFLRGIVADEFIIFNISWI